MKPVDIICLSDPNFNNDLITKVLSDLFGK
jgi:hypothetical protein